MNPTCRQYILTARKAMEISPNQQFCIIVINVSDCAARLHKCVKIADTPKALSAIYVMKTNNQNVPPLKNPEAAVNRNNALLFCNSIQHDSHKDEKLAV